MVNLEEIKTLDEAKIVIRALEKIREKYEEKYGVRMFANGQFKEIQKGA